MCYRSRISVLKTLREARLHLPSLAGGLCGWSRIHSAILYSTHKNTSIHQLMNLHKGRICHSKQQDEVYFSKQTLIFTCCAFDHLFVYVCISYKHKNRSVYEEMQTFLPQNKKKIATYLITHFVLTMQMSNICKLFCDFTSQNVDFSDNFRQFGDIN